MTALVSGSAHPAEDHSISSTAGSLIHVDDKNMPGMPSGPIEVQHAWTRPTPATARNAAVYLTLVNHGAADDRLTAVSTEIAGTASLHVSAETNGVMTMRPLAAVDVTPGATVALQPMGMHIMLEALKGPLTLGQTFPMTLHFDKAGAVTTTVTVGKDANSSGSMPGMKM
ncbi:MAG TPA: copper chaperone PCu(A)C [Stellaceae bacterium]|nr:copper chaperone PCu(A)C [Stellaceae bacterium]